MKFRLTVLIVFSLCLSNVFADEGMWLLGNLRKNKQTDRVMKYIIRRNPLFQMLLSALEVSVREWWFPKTVWCLLIIIVVSVVSSNTLLWNMII